MIRCYQNTDCSQIADLFDQTVHTINTKDYTSDQLNAWADGHVDLAKWNESFLEHYTLVASKTIESLVLGISIQPDISTGWNRHMLVQKSQLMLRSPQNLFSCPRLSACLRPAGDSS